MTGDGGVCIGFSGKGALLELVFELAFEDRHKKFRFKIQLLPTNSLL